MLLTNRKAAKGFQESVGESRKKMDINCNNGVGTNGDKAQNFNQVGESLFFFIKKYMQIAQKTKMIVMSFPLI